MPELPPPVEYGGSFDVLPIAADRGHIGLLESASPGMLWSILRGFVDIPERGLELFPGTRRERMRLWKALASFVNQAETFYGAAAAVRDASAALLYYYAFLNLAKAELLHTDPWRVVDVDPHHGLSYRPGRGSSLNSDRVVTRGGVFELLYRARTGRGMPRRTEMPLTRLIRNLPELVWESSFAGTPEPMVRHLRHRVIASNEDLYSVLAVYPSPDRQLAKALVAAQYVRVRPFSNWRSLFELSVVPELHVALFQSRWSMKGGVNGGRSAVSAQLALVGDRAFEALRHLATIDTTEGSSMAVAPGLYATRGIAMPPDLARYALMFYISSVARYRPQRIDRGSSGVDRWLLGAFTRQAAVPMLHAAAVGVGRTFVTFDPQRQR